jgi:hypothetical protein
MQPAEIALGLPSARFHDLRHSFAVNLLSASPPVDFKRVSKWLGHSTFTLTLDVYGDYINDDVVKFSRMPPKSSKTVNVVEFPLDHLDEFGLIKFVYEWLHRCGECFKVGRAEAFSHRVKYRH